MSEIIPMLFRLLTALCVPLLLAACAEQPHQAPVELKGDTFYGPGSAVPGTAGVVHVVQPRESLSVLAKRYHVSSRSIAQANGLKPPYIIKIGQRLQIPTRNAPLTKGRALAKLDPKTYQSVPVATITSSKVLPPAKEPQHSIAIVKKQDTTAPAQTTPVAPPPAATPVATASASPSAGLFSWPVKGEVLLHFGPGKGGYFNDGINIAAPESTPISAAANGKVVYAGNELRGYGNLVIVRHDNGWLTAYAHQKDMLVKKGDNVTKGQVIGHVGTTGNVTTPQLHFGIRNGKTALNPEEHLPKG